MVKSHAEGHRSSSGSEDAHSGSRLTDKREVAGVGQRNRLIENQATTVHVQKGVYASAVGKIKLETKRRNTCSVSCFTSENARRSHSRARDDISCRNRQRDCVKSILQRYTVIGREGSAIAKCGYDKLAVGGFILVQTAKNGSRFERNSAPETKFVVTFLQAIVGSLSILSRPGTSIHH